MNWRQKTALVFLLGGWLAPSNLAAQAAAPMAPEKKKIIGRVERVELPRFKLILESRVDTGAHSCSLHIENFKVTTENRERYIEFDTEDSDGKKFRIRSRIIQETIVRNTSGESGKRFVIREEVRLAGVSKTVNITLNDRSKLKYGFLVGRNFLRGDFIVDVSYSHYLD